MASPSLKRKMVEEKVQIKDLGVNTSGAVAELPDGIFMEDTDAPIKVVASKPNSKTYGQQQKENQKANRKLDDRPSLDRASLEAQNGDEDTLDQTAAYVVVGFVYPDLDQAFKNPKTRKQAPVGTERPEQSQIKAFDSNEERPLVAVVKILTAEEIKGLVDTHMVKTYVLTIQEHDRGHCKPFVIAQNEVFYLACYRDNTTAKSDRGPAWNQNILEAMLNLDTTGHDIETARPLKLRRSEDVSKAIADARRQFRNELRTIAEELKIGEKWCAEELKEAFRLLDQAAAMPESSASDSTSLSTEEVAAVTGILACIRKLLQQTQQLDDTLEKTKDTSLQQTKQRYDAWEKFRDGILQQTKQLDDLLKK